MLGGSAQRIVITGTALVTGLLIAAGAIGVWGLRAVEAQLTQGLEAHYHHSRLADQMQDASLQRLLVLQAMLGTDDTFRRNELLGELQRHAERFMSAREQLQGLALETTERELLVRQAAAANKAAPLVQQVAALLLQGEDAQASELLLNAVIPAQGALVATLQEIIAEQARQIDRDTRRAEEHSEQAILELIMLASLGVLLAFTIGWLMHRQTTRILALMQGLIRRQRRAATRERAIRKTMLDGLITADREGRILSANRAAEQLLGYARGELVGLNLSVMMPSHDARHHDQYMRHYLSGGQARIIGKGREVDAWRKDGQTIPVELGVVHLRQDGADMFVGFLHDISDRKENERLLKESKANLAAEVMMRTAELETANQRLAQEVAERKQAQELLARQATQDALTGLPNRRLFHQRLKQAVAAARRHGSPLSILYLDLDGFKQVNDHYGHHAGDELLRVVAQRLSGTLRAEDMIARLGGDEFAVLLDHAPPGAELHGIAEKLIRVVSEPVIINGSPVQVGASVGIAPFHEDLDPDSLLRHADHAMYQAKRSGRGRCQMYQGPQSAQSTG